MVNLPSGESSSDEEYNPTGERREHQHRTARKSTTSSNQAAPYSTRRQAAKNASKAIASSAFDKSMETFNPEMSLREKRKLSRKINPGVRRPVGALYDENGVHIQSDMDLCDCLNQNCPGCWFECQKCGSQKCGPDCRVFRKCTIDYIEYHGYDKTVKNPIFSDR